MKTVRINFDKRFKEDIEDERKVSTIRRDRKCERGDKIEMYCDGELFHTSICKFVRPVEIRDTDMSLDGRKVYAGTAYRDEIGDRDNDIAKLEGFDGFMEMAHWFRDKYGDLPFTGFQITWGSW